MIAVVFTDKQQNFNLSNDLDILATPLLTHQLKWLQKQKDVDTIIVLGNHPESKITENKKNIVYLNDTSENLDLAKLIPYLRDEFFFLIYGRVITDLPLSSLVKDQKNTRSNISFVYADKELNTGYFIRVDKNGKLRDFKYNDGAYKHYLNNIFYISAELLTYAPDKDYDFFTQFLPEMLKRNKFIHGLKHQHYLKILNTPDQYYQLNYEILAKENLEISGSKINKIYYGEKCDIDFSTSLIGRQFFGANCQIGASGRLEENIIFNNVRIGKNCIIKNSIICDNVVIGNNCALEKVILGEGVTLADHVKLPPQAIFTKGTNLAEMSSVLNV